MTRPGRWRRQRLPQEGGGAGRRAAPRGRRGGRRPLPGECPGHPRASLLTGESARPGHRPRVGGSRPGAGRLPTRRGGEREPPRQGRRLRGFRRFPGTGPWLPPARAGGRGAGGKAGGGRSPRPWPGFVGAAGIGPCGRLFGDRSEPGLRSGCVLRGAEEHLEVLGGRRL